jgi:hypothetical protein
MTNQLELTSEICDNMLKMMQSSDKDNLTVAAETIRHIDVTENLPYLLILFKESSAEIRTAVFTETMMEDKLKLICKHIDFDAPVTYNAIYNEIKHHNVLQEALEYFLNKFSISIKRNMMEWGFSFLSDFNLKLIPIKNESSRFTSKDQ